MKKNDQGQGSGIHESWQNAFNLGYQDMEEYVNFDNIYKLYGERTATILPLTMCMVTSVKPCVLCSYGSLRIGLQGYSGKVQMEGTIHHVSVNQHKLKGKIVPGAIFVLQTMCFQRYPLKNVGYFRLVPQNVVMFIGIGGEIQNSNSTHWPRMNKVEQDQGSSMLEQGQGSTIPDSWQQAFNLGYQDMEEYVNFSNISELHGTRLETTFPLTMCMVTRVRPYSLCSYGSLRIGLEGYNRKGQMDGVIDYVAVNTHKLKGKIVPGSLFVLQSMCFRSFPSYPIDSFSIKPQNIVLFIGNGGEIHK